MLVFPNCKINLGLHVVSKREDGFHNIETVFYPVNWCDALEVLENPESGEAFVFSQSGLNISGKTEDNLLYKAWRLITAEKKIPNIQVHLHKNIPMGAGLGGGSSDAASFLNILNSRFSLNYTSNALKNMASHLGSDCAFFIENQPVYAKGRGNEFSAIQVDLSSYYILTIYPGIHSNTKEAYDGLTPKLPSHHLVSLIEKTPITFWKEALVNDFEPAIFKKYPEIKLLKENLYAAGAIYASMSGSGSAVFGIFKEEPVLNLPTAFSYYLQKPEIKIL